MSDGFAPSLLEGEVTAVGEEVGMTMSKTATRDETLVAA
jgi:hypothetical protein